MPTKKQLEKKYAAELKNSKAPKGLLQAIYALANDPTLQGPDLKEYDGYRGRQMPSGRQIARAKGLLGIASAPRKVKKAEKRKAGIPVKGGRRAAKASGVAQTLSSFKGTSRLSLPTPTPE